MIINPYAFAVTATDAYWEFVSLLIPGTNNATPADVSKWAHTLTNTNITPSSSDGGYLDFVSGYITTPSHSAFGLGNEDYTLECEVKLDSVGTEQILFDNRTTGHPAVHYVSSDAYKLSLWDSSSVKGNSGTALSTNTWYKAAFTRQGTTLRAFLNGVLQWTVTGYSSSLGTTRPLRVGANYAAGGLLDGRLRNIRVTKGYARYTANYTPTTSPFPTSGPAVEIDPYWSSVQLLLKMKGPAGGQFIDYSQNGYTVTKTGSPALSSAQSNFDGISALIATVPNNHVLTVPYALNLCATTEDFTIEFWAYFTSSGTAEVLYNHGTATGYYTYQMIRGADQKVSIRGFDAGGSLVFNTLGTTVLTTEKWWFIQGRRSGTTFATAVDGVQDATVTLGATTLMNPTALTCIGNYSSGAAYPILGYMDEVRFTKGVARAFARPTQGFYYAPRWVYGFTSSGGTDSAGWSGYTARQTIPVAYLTTGTKVRVTFKAGTSGMVLSSAYIQTAAGSGDPYDFSATPVQILFSGAAGATLGANAELVSDEITLPITTATNLVVSMYFSGTTSLAARSLAGAVGYWRSGNDASTVNTTSYSTTVAQLTGISAIEIYV